MPEYCNRHFHNKMLLVTTVLIIFRLVLEPRLLYIIHCCYFLNTEDRSYSKGGKSKSLFFPRIDVVCS